MKKLVFSCFLIVGCSVYGFATNKIKIQTQNPPQEVKKNAPKKAERFDFSLFKFVKPYTRQVQENDSTKATENQVPATKSKDATTYHHEKPLDFFKFS